MSANRGLDHTVQNLGRNKPTDEAPIMYKVLPLGGLPDEGATGVEHEHATLAFRN